jgi:hypothetical protein
MTEKALLTLQINPLEAAESLVLAVCCRGFVNAVEGSFEKGLAHGWR